MGIMGGAAAPAPPGLRFLSGRLDGQRRALDDRSAKPTFGKQPDPFIEFWILKFEARLSGWLTTGVFVFIKRPAFDGNNGRRGSAGPTRITH
jgi:hypothetical protein